MYSEQELLELKDSIEKRAKELEKSGNLTIKQRKKAKDAVMAFDKLLFDYVTMNGIKSDDNKVHILEIKCIKGRKYFWEIVDTKYKTMRY